MNCLFVGFFFVTLVLTGCETLTPATDANSDSPTSTVAHFQVGDTVIVALSGLPDPILPHEEPIKEDGTITMPYIGSVRALGKTSGQLQNDISTIFTSPNITINLPLR